MPIKIEKIQAFFQSSFLSNINARIEKIKQNLDLSFKQKLQTVGNCTKASSKSGFLALLLLNFPRHIARKLYKEFTLFQRIESLIEYIESTPPQDREEEILKIILKKLQHKLVKYPIDQLIQDRVEDKNFLEYLKTYKHNIDFEKLKDQLSLLDVNDKHFAEYIHAAKDDISFNELKRKLLGYSKNNFQNNPEDKELLEHLGVFQDIDFEMITEFLKKMIKSRKKL